MFTAPKGFSAERLDARAPTSIVRWHRHVNWCIPRRDERQRWTERRDGQRVFGPESPIATRAECDLAGGRFQESVFGWMVHFEFGEHGGWRAQHEHDPGMTGGQMNR